MPLILDEDNIMLAYRMIKSNKGKDTPGVDKASIKQIENMERKKLIKLVSDKLKDYNPLPIRRKYIPKKNGKLRPLGIPSIIDRIIQQAIKQILEPILEAKFYDHSYGFRPDRSQENAIAICNLLIAKGYHYVVDIDIKAFYDNIDHSILLKLLWSRGIRDKKLLSVIKAMLKTPIAGEGIPSKGIPQGGVISPLLANVYLDELDQWIDSQWRNFPLAKTKKYKTNLKRGILVRFADDFKIFTRNRSEAVRWFQAVSQWLGIRLRLECSEEKSRIVNLKKKSSHFLGFSLKARVSKKGNKIIGMITIGKPEKNKIITRLKREYKALGKLSPTSREAKIRSNRLILYIRGIRNYYSIAHTVYADLAEVSFRTYRARDKILQKGPKYEKLLETIFTKACHNSSKEKAKSQGKGVKLNLHSLASFRIAKGFKANNPYNKTVAAHIFSESLRRVRERVKTWGPISVEKADIVLSLFTQQRGKDPITGARLDLNTFECHRKIPQEKYRFGNCILVDYLTHKVIHGTQGSMERFCSILNLNKKRREKLRQLWSLAHSN